MIDLENPSNTCNRLRDFPRRDTGMTVGIIDGLIKACGSDFDIDNCYDYNPETNQWNSSTSTIND